jgi:hypothetical protein
VLLQRQAGDLAMDLDKLFGMFDGVMRIATVALILVAIGSIVLFYRVFQGDFNGPE